MGNIPEESNEKVERKNINGAILFFVCCILISIIVIAVTIDLMKDDKYVVNDPNKRSSTSSSLSKKDSASSSSKMDAWFSATNYVEQSLKAPRTAKFPRYNEEYVTYAGNDIFIISAYVDAQNSFGAMIRNNFRCEVERVNSTNWKLISLSFY